MKLSNVIILFTLPFIAISQDRLIDTLLLKLDDPDLHDSVRYGTYFDIGEQYFYYYEDSIERANYYNDLLLQLATENHSERWKMSHYNLRGRIEQYQSKYEDAIASYEKAVEYGMAAGDTLKAAQNMDNKAWVFSSMRRFNEALPIQLNALEIFKTYNDSSAIGVCHYGLGFTYKERKEYDKSLFNFKECLRYFIKNDGYLAEIHGNLGGIYRDINQIDSALFHFELARNYSTEFPFVYAKNLHEMASLYYDNGDNVRALELLNQIDDIPSYNPGLLEAQSFKILKGNILLDNGRVAEATDIWNDLTPLFDTVDVFKFRANYHEFSRRLFDKKGDKDRVIYHLERYYVTRDSLDKVEVETNFKDIEIKYETEKKEKEIALLNADKELSETKLTAARRQTFGLLGGLIIISGLLFSVFRLYRKTQSQNAIISKSLKEKETLLREIHHRVKNNLQFISSLLGLQTEHVEDKAALGALEEGQNRVQSMALIHQNLYQEDNLTGVDMKEYFTKLTRGLFDSYNIRKDQVKLELDIENVNLDVDSVIPIGLIVNELVSNSLKYAFPESRKGNILVGMKERDNHLELIVKDDGIGIDEKAKKELGTSFGYRLVNVFKDQLKASLDIKNNDGTEVIMQIEKYEKS